MSENSIIHFNIKGINLVSKSMVPLPPDGISGTFSFQIHVESKIEADQSFVVPFVTTIIRKDDQQGVVLAQFQVACIFAIIDFAQHVTFDDVNKLYSIPMHLEKTLRSISISTARGVIFSELRGTYLMNAVLPVIDVTTLVEEASKNETKQIIMTK